MGPVRLYLALLFAAQFVVPLVPSWGAFVPHDHWARSRLTPVDWSAHVQEHRSGTVAVATIDTPTTGTQIVSTLSQNGLTSFEAPMANHSTDFGIAFAPRVVLHTVLEHAFSARILVDPPPYPPPTM